MPQFDLTDFAPQLVWLTLVFAVLYFGIARTMLPKVTAVVDGRQATIDKALAEAENDRANAQAAQTAYVKSLAQARTVATQAAEAAKAQARAHSEAQMRVVDAELAAELAQAEQLLATARAQGLTRVDAMAAEAAQAIVAKLTGLTVSVEEAQSAVALSAPGVRSKAA